MCKQLAVVLAAFQGLRNFTKKCLFPTLQSVFLVRFTLFNFLLDCYASRYILQRESFNHIIGNIIEDVEEMKANSHSDLRA